MTFSDPDVPSTDAASGIIKMQDLLERGHPGEVLPKTLPRVTKAAEDYVRDQGNPPDARTRVRMVWLQGKYLPASLHKMQRRDDGAFG